MTTFKMLLRKIFFGTDFPGEKRFIDNMFPHMKVHFASHLGRRTCPVLFLSFPDLLQPGLTPHRGDHFQENSVRVFLFVFSHSKTYFGHTSKLRNEFMERNNCIAWEVLASYSGICFYFYQHD